MTTGAASEDHSQEGAHTTQPIAKNTDHGTPAVPNSQGDAKVVLPRISIKYCTQCKWMLRAAYFAQELLQTFSTAIGEVALIPVTGGVFTVSIQSADATAETILWDRKTQNGFPEVKQLKALVRDVIEPFRDLGHIDRSLKKSHQAGKEGSSTAEAKDEPPRQCEDCR